MEEPPQNFFACGPETIACGELFQGNGFIIGMIGDGFWWEQQVNGMEHSLCEVQILVNVWGLK